MISLIKQPLQIERESNNINYNFLRKKRNLISSKCEIKKPKINYLNINSHFIYDENEMEKYSDYIKN